VICDTGSSDDTIARIHAALEGIPGELHCRPWIDFGANRTEVLALAKGKADYVLMLDADMTVSFTSSTKRLLSADSYLVRYAGDFDYRQQLLVSGRRLYRYVGKVHEYIEPEPGERTELLETITITHHADGKARAGGLQRDLDTLTAELVRDPGNPRTVFYLAQTHRALGHIDEALEFYERRTSMGGWDEEIFYSLYQAAVLVDRHAANWGNALLAYLRAWEYRPSRLEPVYHIVNRLRRRKELHTAIIFAHPALAQPYPSQDLLFVHRWMYTYGMPLEYAYCCSELGLDDEAILACDIVRARRDAPERVVAEASKIRERVQQRMHGH
jgi:tetratricopeptide (TPR) repeat protein